jgi:hypothetical protein
MSFHHDMGLRSTPRSIRLYREQAVFSFEIFAFQKPHDFLQK